MELRHLELNSNKMNGYIIKEYEPIRLPQYAPIDINSDLKEERLIGFINATRIIGRHPIQRVYRLDSIPMIVLEFKDSFPNIEMSDSEYHIEWLKQGKILKK